MNITGHSKESTFLTYIGTYQNKDALAGLFMKQVGINLAGSGSCMKGSYIFSFNCSKVKLSRTDLILGKM